LVRSQVHQSAVRTQVLFPDGVGYLRWVTVSERSADALREAVAGLVSRGMTTLLLDLRSNPGGLRDEAVRAADLFLDPGQPILETRGRAPGDNLRLHDTAVQRWPTLPIVLLVNGGTASAAEILAGALQDHDRAVVVGSPTYGKGLVQTVFPLGDRVALRLTTARWFTPSGRSIQRPMTDSLGPAGPVDTARRYRTDAGRRLAGGGGIQPDLAVPPDTLTDVEQQLGKLFAANLDGYRDALTGYAVEVRRQRLVPAEDFAVTPAMRAGFLARLRRNGVAVPDSLYEAGARLVDRELGYEIARYSFGRAVESRRRVEEDSQVSAVRALIAAGRIREVLSPASAGR
jgi:carboxyl-terminal processing protease